KFYLSEAMIKAFINAFPNIQPLQLINSEAKVPAVAVWVIKYLGVLQKKVVADLKVIPPHVIANRYLKIHMDIINSCKRKMGMTDKQVMEIIDQDLDN